MTAMEYETVPSGFCGVEMFPLFSGDVIWVACDNFSVSQLPYGHWCDSLRESYVPCTLRQGPHRLHVSEIFISYLNYGRKSNMSASDIVAAFETPNHVQIYQ